MISTRLLLVSATALGLASAAVTATAGSIAGYGVRTGVGLGVSAHPETGALETPVAPRPAATVMISS